MIFGFFSFLSYKVIASFMNDPSECIRYEIIKICFKKEDGGHESILFDFSRELFH